MEDNKKHFCKFCNKEFKSSQSLGAHIIHCSKNPNSYQKNFSLRKKEKFEKYNPLKEYKLICLACGKEYKLQIRQKQFNEGDYRKTCCSSCAHKLSSLHTNLEEKNKKISNSLHKEKILKIKICKYCGKEFIDLKSKSNFCSDECRLKSKSNKCSITAKENNLGGYNPNSIKKHHHGNYKGIHCDSSWELAYVVWCLEHNIKIERCKEIRYYKLNKKVCKYFPDFVINDNEIIEIKGFYDKGAQIKSEQNPDIKVLFKEDLNEVFEYVINKYGNKFWEVLYESNAVVV